MTTVGTNTFTVDGVVVKEEVATILSMRDLSSSLKMKTMVMITATITTTVALEVEAVCELEVGVRNSRVTLAWIRLAV